MPPAYELSAPTKDLERGEDEAHRSWRGGVEPACQVRRLDDLRLTALEVGLIKVGEKVLASDPYRTIRVLCDFRETAQHFLRATERLVGRQSSWLRTYRYVPEIVLTADVI